MSSFILAILRLLRAFAAGLRDEEFRDLLLILIGLLVCGTIFYSGVEGWTASDALYFSVITLATVGYGELHPTTMLSKAFTMVYIVLGVGIFVAFMTKVTDHERRKRTPLACRRSEVATSAFFVGCRETGVHR